MKRREWTAKQKLQIVLDGLKNQISVSDLCSKYSVTQGQYYKWRDQLLNNAEKAFETNRPPTQPKHTPNRLKLNLDIFLQKINDSGKSVTGGEPMDYLGPADAGPIYSNHVNTPLNYY